MTGSDRTLERAVLDGRRMSSTSALLLARDVASAAELLHREGRTHGGIRPAAVVFDDFGSPQLGPAAEGALPAESDGYCAPEGAGVAADLFAVGGVVFFAVCGQPPPRDWAERRQGIEALPVSACLLLFASEYSVDPPFPISMVRQYLVRRASQRMSSVVRVWAADSGHLLGKLDTGSVQGIALSADGRWLAATDGDGDGDGTGLQLWRLDTRSAGRSP